MGEVEVGCGGDLSNLYVHIKTFNLTRGPSGPEIAHLDKADHGMLDFAMVAIFAIRSDCL